MNASVMKPLWKNGWYATAQHMPSPNFGSRPPNTVTDLLVIHSISLPPGEFGGSFIHALFTNQLDWEAHPYFKSIENIQVSSHFLIERNGALWQFVSTDDRAWHAGVSTYLDRSDCNDFSIGIELEGLEGGGFELAQYDALRDLTQALADQLPLHAVTGHEHIAPGRKSDPGAGFDWQQLQSVAQKNNLQWGAFE